MLDHPDFQVKNTLESPLNLEDTFKLLTDFAWLNKHLAPPTQGSSLEGGKLEKGATYFDTLALLGIKRKIQCSVVDFQEPRKVCYLMCPRFLYFAWDQITEWDFVSSGDHTVVEITVGVKFRYAFQRLFLGRFKQAFVDHWDEMRLVRQQALDLMKPS